MGAEQGVVEVGAEINESGLRVVEQVPDDDQDGPADRDEGFLLAAPARDASIAFAEEGVGLAGR
ncbi:MAG: hypothetical protein L0H96_04285 [Humibacillus sp.]|nr:hypothetical protein [Humibacillus sp.]